jgi:hypothetical protein
MSATNRSIDPKQKLNAAFYWLGIALSVACISLVLIRNTELLWRFEHADFPLSWAAGMIAILAFLAAEYFDPATAEKRSVRPVPEVLPENPTWETEFADS